jgi:hypothetical protein
MSWKTINAILGLAAVDEVFCQELLKNPVEAIQARNFQLTHEEQEKLRSITAHHLEEFSRMALILLGPGE